MIWLNVLWVVPWTAFWFGVAIRASRVEDKLSDEAAMKKKVDDLGYNCNGFDRNRCEEHCPDEPSFSATTADPRCTLQAGHGGYHRMENGKCWR